MWCDDDEALFFSFGTIFSLIWFIIFVVVDHLAANTQAHHTHNIYSIHSIQFISIPIPFNSAGISSLSFQLAVSFAYIRTKRSVPPKLIHNTHSTGLPLQTKHKNNCIENADINIQDTHAHTHTIYYSYETNPGHG